MKFLLAMIVWVAMGTMLARGLVMAVHGTVWLLVLSAIAFIVLVAKIGCLSHD